MDVIALGIILQKSLWLSGVPLESCFYQDVYVPL